MRIEIEFCDFRYRILGRVLILFIAESDFPYKQKEDLHMKAIRMPLFERKCMDSRIKSANVQNSERWIGYFLGPGGVILLNGILASFLNVYWTDVAKINGLWGGAFILVFPIVSKIIDAITNVIMGQIIDHTKTRQGHARPWLLVGIPIIAIAAVLCFSIPKASPTVQALWIMFSYNLYYSFTT